MRTTSSCSANDAIFQFTNTAMAYLQYLKDHGNHNSSHLNHFTLSRYCNVCQANLDPSVLHCELCSYHHGAYKPTQNGRWVHVKCASWIPEVYVINPQVMEPFILDKVDKLRYRLKCSLCKLRGACVQCKSGRCSTAGDKFMTKF